MRTLLLLALCAIVFTAIFLFYPPLYRLNDEANYVATAFKMGATYELTAATHHTADILDTGIDHKHLKMPGYLMALAAWLKVVPDARFAQVPSQLFFAAAVFVLFRFVLGSASRPVLESTMAGLSLLATPLGLAFASTAMMETCLLFVAALHFVSWFGPRGEKNKLLRFYTTAFLCFITKETLILLSLSIVATHPREFVKLHRDILQQSKGKIARHAVLLLLLLGMASWCYVDRGHNPVFYVGLMQEPGLDKFAMMGSKFVENVERFASRNRFPHDYFYGYTLVIVTMTAALCIKSRGDRDAGVFLSLLVTWRGCGMVS